MKEKLKKFIENNKLYILTNKESIITQLEEKENQSLQVVAEYHKKASKYHKEIIECNNKIIELQKIIKEKERAIEESESLITLHKTNRSNYKKLIDLIEQGPLSQFALLKLRKDLRAEGFENIIATKTNAGRPKGYLFENEDKTKDEKLTKKWADLFVAYLKKHKNASVELDSKLKNPISLSFCAFYLELVKKGIVKKDKGDLVKATAICHFLSDDCNLKISISSIRSIPQTLNKILDEPDRRISKEERTKVKDFIKEQERLAN